MFNIQEELKALPHSPGVYQMKNASGEIIYVGKAKSLNKRVKQYFQSRNHPPKIQAMIKNISEFEYIITDNEVEALILEAEAEKQSAILRAEAQKEKMIRESEGEALAILKVQQAKAENLLLLWKPHKRPAIYQVKAQLLMKRLQKKPHYY